MKYIHQFLSVFVMVLCLSFAGCKEKKAIEVYLVSKPASETRETTQAPLTQDDSTGGMQQQAPTSLDLNGIPPSDWEAQPLTVMRQASYLARGTNGTTADISLITLTGAAGGMLDNVNRWLSQLGQPEITTEELARQVKHVNSPLGDVSVVDLEGLPQGGDATKDGRIIAGIVSGDKGTLFFKMRGNAPLVESQKKEFIQWIGSVKIVALPQGAPTESTAPASATLIPAAEQKNSQILWDVPQDWRSVPASSMRYASFSTAGNNGQSGNVSISVFGGDGGGDLANVNRWRTQIGLKALNVEELKSLIVPIACKDGEILTVDMNGATARIIAGWARVDGKSWFFKLIGPTGVVEGEKAKFKSFLQSVKFHP